MSKAILTLKGISKDYKQGRSIIEVLKNANLTVHQKEMVAIVGASGSGKSTLLHIAGLLDTADSGGILIDNVEDIRIKNLRYSNRVRLENMGFIYQYHHLLTDFTAQENAAMPLLINNIPRKKAMERSATILEELGLGKRLYSVPGKLSGGEQQRVAVARALINNPKIILADEPTGDLDPHTADEVFAIFLERIEKENAAIIMVTHNLELAAKMNKTYKLSEGSLIEFL